jgi:hypothetical protein
MSETMTFRGRFQWWAYTVSHGQLLLRRTKQPEHPSRVDVLFKDVAAVSLPTCFDDLSISDGDPRGLREIPGGLGAWAPDGRRLFIARGTNWSGFVVAGAVFFHEDDKEYSDPSAFSDSWLT